MSEHQRINQTNYNTTQLDKRVGRGLGFHSRKAHRKMRGIALAQGPRNPHKTSGRRQMRTLLEGLRTFAPSQTHPRGNREARRKATKIAISKDRRESRKKGARFSAVWDMRLWWHSPHHQIIPRGFLKNLDGTLPEDFRD